MSTPCGHKKNTENCSTIQKKVWWKTIGYDYENE